MSAPQPGYKRCPDCAEDVREEARRCRFCGYSFERGSQAGGALEFLRRPRPTMTPEGLLTSWGVELDAGDELERISYCRLGDTDGFLVVTGRRVLFFTAKKPRCVLEVDRGAVSGTARRARFGRSRIELNAGGRTSVLSGFVSRRELLEVASSLGVAAE